MNILLIDDEPFALQLLARQLANLGVEELIPCEHAHDALAALESGVKAIGLVFCDLQMPHMDGVELEDLVGYCAAFHRFWPRRSAHRPRCKERLARGGA